MTISEEQLDTWSSQGSITQSKLTHETIRAALDDHAAPFHNRLYTTYLQGSYGNDTNIFADSDVDIVMCLTSVYYSDLSSLSEGEAAQYQKDRVSADYTYAEFKHEVLAWLVHKFGKGVKAGSKAIFVPGEGGRRDADVLVCVNHRSYYSYTNQTLSSYHDGICFWTDDDQKIVNYPKQHLANCTAKHQQTSSRFKRNVRVLKNMRNAMIRNGYLKDGIAPSYYIEGMLWNIPEQLFEGTFQTTFVNYMNWLDGCNTGELVCANERYYLLRDGSQVCWNLADFNVFRSAAKRFWNAS